MAVEIVTREDLQAFRMQLLADIKLIFGAPAKEEKVWLKNCEVMKLLKVSANTVQRLRIAGKLRSSKIGGVHYYRYQDIQELLESGLEGVWNGKH
ncbi:MAG TPA: helix-turn-helix domain-containing protein [Flavisolibacter sp.]|nr:helix-turn-helix domain-containing protein [Flavisolibacter sp.]